MSIHYCTLTSIQQQKTAHVVVNLLFVNNIVIFKKLVRKCATSQNFEYSVIYSLSKPSQGGSIHEV